MNKFLTAPLVALAALVATEAQGARYLIADITATGSGTGFIGSRTGSRADSSYSFTKFYSSLSFNLEGNNAPTAVGSNLRVTGDMLNYRVSGLFSPEGFSFSAIQPLQSFVALAINGTACFANSNSSAVTIGTPSVNSSCSPFSVNYSDGFFVTGYSFTGAIDSINFRVVEATSLPAITFAIPEPATWALMLAGFGMVGYAMRRRRTAVAVA